jgi:transcriptional regulator with XRE-family HTH domain
MTPEEKLQTRLGKRCRQLRRGCGLSQLDMVRNFDFSLSHYQKIERGDLDARLSTLKRLADCFRVTLSQLLEGV